MWESAEIYSNEFVFVLQAAYVFMRACVCVCVRDCVCRVRACVCVLYLFLGIICAAPRQSKLQCVRERAREERKDFRERAGAGELVSNGFLCGNQHRIVC